MRASALAGVGALLGLGAPAAMAQAVLTQHWDRVPSAEIEWCAQAPDACNQYALEHACFYDPETRTASLEINPALTNNTRFVGVYTSRDDTLPNLSPALFAFNHFEEQGLFPDGLQVVPIIAFVDDLRPETTQRGALCFAALGGYVDVSIGPHKDAGTLAALTTSKVFDAANFLSLVTLNAVEDSSVENGFPMAARISSGAARVTTAQYEFLAKLGVSKVAVLGFGKEEFQKSVKDGARRGELVHGISTVATEFVYPLSSDAQIEPVLRRIIASRCRIILFMVEMAFFVGDTAVISMANSFGMFDGGFNWFGDVWPLYTGEVLGMKQAGIFFSLTGVDRSTSFARNLLTFATAENVSTPSLELIDRGGERLLAPMGSIFDTAAAALFFTIERHRRGIDHLDPEIFREIVQEMRFDGVGGPFAFDDNFERMNVSLNLMNMNAFFPDYIGKMMNGRTTLVRGEETFTYPSGATSLNVDFDMDCSFSTAYTTSVSDCSPMRTVSKERKPGDAMTYCPAVPSYEILCDYAHFEAVTGAVVMNSVGVLLTLLCMLNLVRHWHHPMVRSGQPWWLLCMCVGALICQIGFPLGSLGELSRSKCMTARFTLSTGALLVLGSLVVKLVRLRRIMMSRTFRKKTVGNTEMVIKVALLVGFNIGILLVGELVPSSRTEIGSAVHYTEQGDPVSHTLCIRESQWPDYVATGLVALCAIYSCALANEARQLSSALNEGLFVFGAVYNATISAAVVFLFAFVTHDSTVVATVYAVGLFLACTGTVVLILFKRFYVIVTMPVDTNWTNFITGPSSKYSKNPNSTASNTSDK